MLHSKGQHNVGAHFLSDMDHSWNSMCCMDNDNAAKDLGAWNLASDMGTYSIFYNLNFGANH